MLKINVSTQVLLIGTCNLSRRFSKTLEGGEGGMGRGEGGRGRGGEGSNTPVHFTPGN